MTERFPWFAARLLFECHVDSRPSDRPLYEERIVLVHTDEGVDAAAKKAQKLGKAAVEEYRNQAGESVAWVFKEVLDLVQLSEVSIGEGTEVYHQYLSEDEVEQVRRSLRAGSL